MSAKRAAQLLNELEANGVANRSIGDEQRFVPVPPADVVDALRLRREQELLQARRNVMRFVEEAAGPAGWQPRRDFLQVIVGADAARDRWNQMILNAKKEILAFNTSATTLASDEWVKAKVDLLRSGVRGRVVHDRESLEAPGMLNLIRKVAFAEDARTVPVLPLPLAIVDRRAAYLPLTQDRDQDSEILVVYESPFLDLLIMMFEAVWHQAAPFDVASNKSEHSGDSELSDDELTLLTLLGAGMKENSIASQFGINPRTVERRLSSITARLGTATRFQTAVEACRKGWISGPSNTHKTD